MSRCKQINCTIHISDYGVKYIVRYELNAALKKNKLYSPQIIRRLDKLAKITIDDVTCFLWWDVEAILEGVMREGASVRSMQFVTMMMGAKKPTPKEKIERLFKNER